jgi:hypothetical protein
LPDECGSWQVTHPAAFDSLMCLAEDAWSWHVTQSPSAFATVNAGYMAPWGSWQVVQSPPPSGPWMSFFPSFRSWHW